MAPNLAKGGAEDIIVNLSSHFSKNNDVKLFLFHRCCEDEYNVSRLLGSVDLISLINSNESMHSKKIKNIMKFLYLFSPIISIYIFLKYKIYKYDIVHINMTAASFYLPFFWVLTKLCFFSKTKYIETFHTNWHLLKSFNKVIFPISWSLVDHVVFEIGEHEFNNIKKYSLAKKISYIPFAVPPSEENDNLFLEDFRAKHLNDISDCCMKIMTISRLRVFEKKIDCMLLIAKRLKENNFNDFVLILCGDGPDKEIIENKISEFGLIDNVILTGFIDKPQQIVKLSDLFIVAMVDASTGIAGLQAGMEGVPVIGIQTSKGYDSQNDVIFSSEDINEIVTKIMLFNNENILEDYALKTKKHIEKYYSIDTFNRSYLELYEELFENSTKKQIGK